MRRTWIYVLVTLLALAAAQSDVTDHNIVVSESPPTREYLISYPKTDPVMLIYKVTATESITILTDYHVQDINQYEKIVYARIEKVPFINMPLLRVIGYGNVRTDIVYEPVKISTCVDDYVCSVSSTVGNSLVSQRIFTSSSLIEHTMKITLVNAVNCIFTLPNGQNFDRELVFVLPRKHPDGPNVSITVMTSASTKIDDFCKYDIVILSRVGNYSVTGDGYLYDFPYIGSAAVSQSFGGNSSHQIGTNSQYAVDFDLTADTPVYSARNGVVFATLSKNALSQFDASSNCPLPITKDCPSPNAQPNYVLIRHDDGTWGAYQHFKQNGVTVHVGDVISKKTLIGYTGNTGFSTGAHVHFEVAKATSLCNTLGWTKETLFVEYATNNCVGVVPKVDVNYTGLASYRLCNHSTYFIAHPAKDTQDTCSLNVWSYIPPAVNVTPPSPSPASSPSHAPSPLPVSVVEPGKPIPAYVWIIIFVVIAAVIVLGVVVWLVFRKKVVEEENV